MARRYCDGRSTYIASHFNRIYNALQSEHPHTLVIDDMFDPTIKFWPYAQDGMYNPKTGAFDARPISVRLMEKENEQ